MICFNFDIFGVFLVGFFLCLWFFLYFLLEYFFKLVYGFGLVKKENIMLELDLEIK